MSSSGRERLANVDLTLQNKIARFCWNLVSFIFYRFSPAPLHAWRALLLRCFGAKIGKRVYVYPSARIWAPWNLVMADDSCMGHHVDCYSVAPVSLGPAAIVSQYTYLCTASHDYTLDEFPLIAAPISIGARAWVAAGAFVGPGVSVGEGAVVAARAVVVKDIVPWTVCAGNPARTIKVRNPPSSGRGGDSVRG